MIPIPPAMKTYGRSVSRREDELALRMFDVHLCSDRQLGERALERGVAQAGGEAERAAFVRRGRDRDVATRPFLVVIRRVEQGQPEVLAGAEVDLLAEQVEADKERPLRDLALLLDRGAHA